MVIGNFTIFILYLLISFIILFIGSKILKNSDQYIAKAFILFAFTTLYYKSFLFFLFSGLLWISIIFAANYLENNPKKIIQGILLGLLSVLLSFYISNLL